MALGLDSRTTGADSSVPAATRAATPGWRDPRLWVGLVIVAVSVVAGSRLLASADDTVAVWAVVDDAGPGAQLSEADLQVRRVRFADADAVAGYLTADSELPATVRLVRAVGAGELLPRAAIGADDAAADVVELPIAVDPDRVPPSVAAGSVVDVYLLGGSGRPRDRVAAPTLAAVTVVAAPSSDGGLGSVAGLRQLVVAVPEADAAAFLTGLGETDEPALTVVRRS